VLSNLLAIAGALQGIIDPKTAAIIMAVLNGLYNLVRGISKSTASATVTTTSVNPGEGVAQTVTTSSKT